MSYIWMALDNLQDFCTQFMKSETWNVFIDLVVDKKVFIRPFKKNVPKTILKWKDISRQKISLFQGGLFDFQGLYSSIYLLKAGMLIDLLNICLSLYNHQSPFGWIMQSSFPKYIFATSRKYFFIRALENRSASYVLFIALIFV